MRVALALLVLVAAGCGSGVKAEERAGTGGVTLMLPSGWVSNAAADGAISDPVTRIVVSSGPLPHRRTACPIANYGPADDQVALVVVEWAPAADVALGERPEQFTAANLPAEPGGIVCFAGAGGTVQFAEAGRNLGAYLLLGRQAPAGLAEDARSVLDSLRVEPG
jgi:hypothetical protein